MTRGQQLAARLIAALAFFGAIASEAAAQTAEQVISRHIKAMGGAKALKSISGTSLTGTVNGSGEFLWRTRAPSAYYLEIRKDSAHEVEAFNGNSAWREDAAGLRTLTGKEQARARALGPYRNDHFLNYKRDKTRINLAGRETVDGRNAFVIEVTTAAGIQRKVSFDAQTYLILREEGQREGLTEEFLFSDYRPVDGVPEPNRIRILRGPESLELLVRSTTHTASRDASLFDFPRRDSAPLPDVATLFKQVEDNQKALQKARQDYTYTKTETEIEIDDKGRIKEKSERTYEVSYAFGREIEKLVAKNGEILQGDAARREQERIEKLIRGQKEKEAKRAAEERAEAAKKDTNDDELTLAQLLRVSQFVNPRRERFRGNEVVVFDFEPRQGARPKNRAESWIQKLSGNIWIDEQAREIVRAEGRLNDGIKMAGGFVLSVQRGAAFAFEQELVKGEVWLPSYAEVSASMRFLLVKGFKVNQQVRFSDYRKFTVDTSTEMKRPSS